LKSGHAPWRPPPAAQELGGGDPWVTDGNLWVGVIAPSVK
jgi:hypothetical protein